MFSVTHANAIDLVGIHEARNRTLLQRILREWHYNVSDVSLIKWDLGYYRYLKSCVEAWIKQGVIISSKLKYNQNKQ